MCSLNSQLNWNYYFITNETNQIARYDGYKRASLTQQNGTWKLQTEGVLAETSSDYPLGRRQWNYIDRACGIKSAIKTSLTLSRCYFGKEFTCDSGECISMSQRCNTNTDCDDGSDEEMCHLVQIPNSYNKILSPGAYGKNDEPVSLLTHVNIISVDLG